MADSEKLLATLNTSLDKDNEVVEFAERTFLSPRFNIFPRHIVQTGIAVVEPLVITNKEKGFGGQIDYVTLTAESVDFGVILDVKSA